MTYLKNLTFGASPEIQRRAVELRKRMTPAEKVLWDKMKNISVFQHKFRRQHPINKYIVDFYCHRLHLAIEVDGGIHDNPENKEYDENRTYCLNELGITVVRFTNDEVLTTIEGVVERIIEEVRRIEGGGDG